MVLSATRNVDSNDDGMIVDLERLVFFGAYTTACWCAGKQGYENALLLPFATGVCYGMLKLYNHFWDRPEPGFPQSYRNV